MSHFYTIFLIFIEGVFSPFPSDIMSLYMLKEAGMLYSTIVCTVSSVMGCITGYFVGKFYGFKYIKIIEELLNLEGIETIKQLVVNNAGFIIILKSFTPLPTFLLTTTMGTLKCNFINFAFMVLIGRSLKYLILFACGKAFEKESSMVTSVLFITMLISITTAIREKASIATAIMN